MKQLSASAQAKKSAMIAPLQDKLKPLFTARLTQISRMSGYPVGLQSIGRLQSVLNFNALNECLESLIKVYDIAFVASEVIESLDGIKIEKFQIDRTSIQTYVDNLLRGMTITLTPDDVDIIAQLVVSFEGNPGSWMLVGSDPASSLHFKFAELYRTVMLTTTPRQLPAYDTVNRNVVAFEHLVQNEKLVNAIAAEQDPAKKQGLEDELDAAAIFYQYSMVRVIDHLYTLMMDKDVWYQFVSPRLKAELASSLERGKTLRILAVYLQSLLAYPCYFSAEVFLKGNSIMEEWMGPFAPLDPNTINNINNKIRYNDVLNARGDVDSLFDSFSKAASNEYGAMVIPAEILVNYSLKATIRAHEQAAGSATLSADLSNLMELLKPKYLPLLSGEALAVLDMKRHVIEYILEPKIVANKVMNAVKSIVPTLNHGASTITMDALKRLSFKAPQTFIAPSAPSWQVTAGSEQIATLTELSMDSASPNYSFEYHRYLRDSLMGKVSTDSLIQQGYHNFCVPFVPDFDKAAYLRETIGLEWNTFIPSWLATTNQVPLTFDVIVASRESIKELILQMVNIPIEVFTIQLTLSHVRQEFATYASSFALVYYDETLKDDPINNDTPTMYIYEVSSAPILVTGIGYPYGTSYGLLASLQPPLAEGDRLIYIGRGVSLRLLSRIPVVTDDLRLDPDFYIQKSNFYFAAPSSSAMPVERWVIGKGLQNFSYVPINNPAYVPNIVFNARYVYMTAKVFINTDLYYKPAGPEKSREVYPIGLQTSNWPYDVEVPWLEYKHFGAYSASNAAPPDTTPSGDTTSSISAIVKEIEKQETEIVEERRDVQTKLEPDLKSSMIKTEDEIKEGIAKQTPHTDPSEGKSVI